jgi:hypothetical protein
VTAARRHGLLAWSLLLCVLAAFFAGAYLPLLDYRDEQRERYAATLDRVQRLQRLARSETRLREELATLDRSRLESSASLVTAGSLSQGSAGLQRLVSDRVAGQGVRQLSIQPLQPLTDQALPQLSLNAQLEGAYDNMHSLLYELETGIPRVFVDELVIETRRPARRRARRGAPAVQTTDTVTARLRLSAFMEQLP